MKIRAFLRIQALPAICMAGLLTLACDKIYEEKLSLTVPETGTASAESLAADLLSHLSKQFPLRCEEPETWTAPPDSSEKPEVHRECTDRSNYTRITVVASGNEISVKIHKISGFREPEGYRAIRLATRSYLEQAVPGATVVATSEPE